MTGTKYTLEILSSWMDRLCGGESIHDLADSMNLNYQTVTRILNKAGLSVPRSGFFVEKQQDEIIRLWNEGKTKEFIAAELGVATTTLRKWMQSNEDRLQRRLMVRDDIWPIERRERAVELWGMGWGMSRIGADIGVTKNAVIGFVNRSRDKFPARADVKPGPVPKRQVKVDKGVGRGGEAKAIRIEKALLGELPDMTVAKVVFDPTEYDISRAPGVELWRLESWECKWSINDGKPFMFCGAGASGGKPYCEHHTKRAYTVPPPSMRMRNLRPMWRDS